MLCVIYTQHTRRMSWNGWFYRRFRRFSASGFGNGGVVWWEAHVKRHQELEMPSRQQTYKSISHSIRTSSKRAERHCYVSCNSGTHRFIAADFFSLAIVFHRYVFDDRDSKSSVLVHFHPKHSVCSTLFSLLSLCVWVSQCQLVSWTWYYTLLYGAGPI